MSHADEVAGSPAGPGADGRPARQLTDALLAPPATAVSAEARDEVRARLEAAVPGLVGGLPPGSELTVGLPLLIQRARDQAVPTGPEDPFAWKPAFVRRSLGLATVEACLERRFRWPTEAVGPVADRAVAEWQRTGWRTFHWEPWFAALSGGARAAVLAEAGTWATSLWTSLGWHRLPVPPRLGGPDDQWICPAPRTVRLRGRCEVRIPLLGAPGGSQAAPVVGTALVSLMSGVPAASGEAAELAFLALVASLRSPSRPVPSRVVGLWPHSGEHRIVEVTDQLLVDATSSVLGAVEALAGGAAGAGAGPDGSPGRGRVTTGPDRAATGGG